MGCQSHKVKPFIMLLLLFDNDGVFLDLAEVSFMSHSKHFEGPTKHQLKEEAALKCFGQRQKTEG